MTAMSLASLVDSASLDAAAERVHRAHVRLAALLEADPADLPCAAIGEACQELHAAEQCYLDLRLSQ
ncbi:hypothetical protein GCM10009765_26010 [Fodinicola feengrottensis]|uniref:Uncharacterized protein n=1 Tax=Fodinicola feengrottensis TaxID=435914 RepID=A0ABN2GR80_9ACTN